MASSGFAGLTSRFNLTKPLIAAVNGVSMGGGFEIALACDLIVASTNAKFALPEPKVGLAALAGGMQRLPRQIGMKNALGMMLTGRHVSAEEGMRLGFVNEVVEPENLISAAKAWAKQIEECSPMSIRATKQVAYENFNEPDLEKSMKAHYSAVKALFGSEDFIEGGEVNMNKATDLLEKAENLIPVDSVTLLSPILNPQKILIFNENFTKFI